MDPKRHKASKSSIPCYDPGSMAYLGTMQADSAEAVGSDPEVPHMACLTVFTQCYCWRQGH